jgi:TetR/AcrR family transcriptional repressor of lmrAB and yxaGH operons
MIRSAYELVRLQGYRGTSLIDIAAEGALPRGSMYFHFPGGKQELAAEVAGLAGSEIEAWVASIAEDAGSPAEIISRLFGLFIASLEASQYAQGCAVAALIHEAGPADEDITSACRVALDGWQRALGEAFGSWVPDRDGAGRLATLVMASLEGALLLAKAQRSTAPLVVIAEDLGRYAQSLLAPVRTDRGQGTRTAPTKR